MKYKAGDEITLNAKIYESDVDGVTIRFPGVARITLYLHEDEFEPMISAKQAQPTPVAPEGWQPQVGDRVLVVGTVSDAPSAFIPVKFSYTMSEAFGGDKREVLIHIDRSNILGLAPERKPEPRFKVGDEVWVKAIIERGPDDENDYSVSTEYHCVGGPVTRWKGTMVSRSAIIGPAPVTPKQTRFKVGDEVFSNAHLRRVTLKEYDLKDQTWRIGFDNMISWVAEDEIITLAEAIERLAKGAK